MSNDKKILSLLEVMQKSIDHIQLFQVGTEDRLTRIEERLTGVEDKQQDTHALLEKFVTKIDAHEQKLLP
jgi:hypothetical protein